MVLMGVEKEVNLTRACMGYAQATDEDEIMRSLAQLEDLRNELEAADEREKLMRQQLREAENALISARADVQRAKASTNGHEKRKAELESALAQVLTSLVPDTLLGREPCLLLGMHVSP